jgi:pimeloyl-ACP methyl ester carboxylesterase
MAKIITLLLTATLVANLCSCASVTITRDSERVTQQGIESAQLLRRLIRAPIAGLELLADSSTSILERARILENSGQRDDAATVFFKAAVDSGDFLEKKKSALDPNAQTALIDLHNRSLARFAEIWLDQSERQGTSPKSFTYQDIRYDLELSPTSDYQPEYFDRVVSAESISGKGIVEKSRGGVGAALVGIRDQLSGREEEMEFFPESLHLPVTLIIERAQRTVKKDGTHVLVTLSLKNPLLHEFVTVQGERIPLAANFSAPLEMLLDGNSQLGLALARFFKASEVAEKSGIYLLEPYDPNRIPVILTHGLVSVPIIWRDLLPQLMAEPDIAKRYQFMVFTYPSSYPISESALLYRQQLAKLRAKYDPRGRDPLSKNMVAVGHSMGGILTRTLVTDLGDNLWNQFSDVPLEQLGLEPEVEERARELAWFEPDPGIRRAVFMSTPHRGATQAETGLAGWLSSLAALPREILSDNRSLLDQETAAHIRVDLGKKITSVQSLQPTSPIVKALDVSPYKKGVIYHSIIGDRGRGDSPNSSDGNVEYWSSHQEGAASELIVPTEHNSYTYPGSVDELKRILRLHVGLK